MKLVFSVLLVLVVGDFVFAKDAKSSKDKSATLPHYCIDAEANAVKVGEIGTNQINKACADVANSGQSECLEKAKSQYCKLSKAGVQLYGSLSEVPNNSTCTQFANKILENRGLGKLDKPAASVVTKTPVTYSEGKVPSFRFDIAGTARTAVYASSDLNKATKEETWTLSIAGNSEVPSFEQRKEFGTDQDVGAGEYRRHYKFKVVNNVCVLQAIEMTFSPLAPKGEEGYPKYQTQAKNLTQKECDYGAQSVRGENYKKQFGKTPSRDLLNNWVCNEAVTAFNQPENVAPVTNNARHGRGHKGDERVK